MTRFLLLPQSIAEQCIPLGALFQCAALAESVAQTGKFPPALATPLFHSVLLLQPPSIQDIYPDLHALQVGYATAKKVLEKKKDPSTQRILRYALDLMILERKLSRDKKNQQHIQTHISKIHPQVQHLGLLHPTVIHNMAELYVQTFGRYRHRIHIRGLAKHLQTPLCVDEIRAVLLCGIRAATLWHQLGGRFYHFIFYRKKFIQGFQSIRGI